MFDKLLRKIPVIAMSIAVTPMFVGADGQVEFDKTALPSTPLLGQVSNFVADGFTSRSHDVAKAQVKAVEEKKINGNIGTKQPSRFDAEDFTFFLDGQFLYWKAKQDGLEYAVQTSSAPASTPAGPKSLLGGSVKDIDFNWGPGSRITFGYHMNYDSWDLASTWAHFHKGSHTSSKVHPGGGLTATWLLIGGDATTPPAFDLFSASARYHICYDTLDITLSRNFFVSRALTITPKIGFRNAWIDQLAKLHYLSNSHDVGVMEGRLKNNFYGVGSMAGVDMSYWFCQNWSLWGKLAGSLLYGFFNVKETIGFDKAIVGHPVTSSLRDHLKKLATDLETGIGIQWEMDFNRNKAHVAVFAGYEFLVWFSQNQLKNFFLAGFDNGLYSESQGDLSLMGLTTGVRFDF